MEHRSPSVELQRVQCESYVQPGVLLVIQPQDDPRRRCLWHCTYHVAPRGVSLFYWCHTRQTTPMWRLTSSSRSWTLVKVYTVWTRSDTWGGLIPVASGAGVNTYLSIGDLSEPMNCTVGPTSGFFAPPK